jgi:hypothetical protein
LLNILFPQFILPKSEGQRGIQGFLLSNFSQNTVAHNKIRIFIISNNYSMTKQLLIITGLFLWCSNSFSQGTWTQKANFSGGAISEECAFGIANLGYFGANTANLWEYDPVSDAWTQKAAFAGTIRASAAGFSIGTKGYFGTGGGLSDFWEWDQTTDIWTQKANFGGAGREGASGCSIDSKGYIGLGGNYLADWWEYDPGSNTWTQKASLPTGRYHAGAFAIGGKGYISCGFNGSFFNDLWEFDPVANTWTQRANMPGTTRDRPVGMAIGTKGYIVTGWTGTMALNDAWEWDQASNTWTQLPSCPGAARYNACGFAAMSKIYVGTGYANANVDDFWEYAPSCSIQTLSQLTSCIGACDGTATVISPDSAAAVSYLWSTSETTQTISGLCAGSYSVSVTDTSGCSTNTIVIVSDPLPVTAIFLDSVPACNGGNDGSICAITSGGTAPYTYVWTGGLTTDCIQNLTAGIYSVTITDSHGCTGSAVTTLSQPTPIQITFSHTDAGCATCPTGIATATGITGGMPPYSYLWSTGATTPSINSLLPGTYTFCATDLIGCVHCDSVIISWTSSVQALNGAEQFTLSPNPFNDCLNIYTGAAEQKNMKIKLSDKTGRIINVKTIQGKQKISLDTKSLSDGIYFVEINLNGKSRFIKAIKCR